MQFDIKYAYFNFLQSIHYRSTLTQPKREKYSGSHVSNCNLIDKSCTDSSAVDVVDSNQDEDK